MRTSSGDRSIRNYAGGSKPVRVDSDRTPPGGVRRDSGMGWDRRGGDALPPSSVRQKEIRDYVARILPDEHLGLAVSAALSIRLSGEKPTAEAIRLRLQGSGRSIDQLRAKGWTP